MQKRRVSVDFAKNLQNCSASEAGQPRGRATWFPSPSSSPSSARTAGAEAGTGGVCETVPCGISEVFTASIGRAPLPPLLRRPYLLSDSTDKCPITWDRSMSSIKSHDFKSHPIACLKQYGETPFLLNNSKPRSDILLPNPLESYLTVIDLPAFSMSSASSSVAGVMSR